MDAMERLAGQAVEYDGRLCSQLISHYRNLLVELPSSYSEYSIVRPPQTLEQYKKQVNSSFTPGRVNGCHQNAAGCWMCLLAHPPVWNWLCKLSDRGVKPSWEALVARIEELEAKLNRLLAEAPARNSRLSEECSSHNKRNRPQVVLPGMEPPPQQKQPHRLQSLPTPRWDHDAEEISGCRCPIAWCHQ